jgi:large subunit ribosomal protein L40
MIRYSLYHYAKIAPKPLNLSRSRALRHWTIQRAWNIYTSKKREEQQLELERQWNAMRAACEELRTGVGDGGRLYRQAMSKKGVWGGRSDLGLLETEAGTKMPTGEGGRVEKGREAGIPIEYGRGLTDYPPRNGFDESWTR